MIENKDLYSFEQETDFLEQAPESNSLEDFNFRSISTLLYQTIIAFICLILLLTFSHSTLSWLEWARARMHTAINASSTSTFGKINNSKLWKAIIANTGNLVQLEKITKNQFAQETMVNHSDVTVPSAKKTAEKIFQNSVWPVQGSIVKGYGWHVDAIGKTKIFQPGIEMSAIPDSTVLAIADGIIAEIMHQPETGWKVVIRHDDGWSSSYFYLGPVQVKNGQKVKAGDTIARINRPTQDKGPILLLEIKEYDQAIDPLAVLAS